MKDGCTDDFIERKLHLPVLQCSGNSKNLDCMLQHCTFVQAAASWLTVSGRWWVWPDGTSPSKHLVSIITAMMMVMMEVAMMMVVTMIIVIVKIVMMPLPMLLGTVDTVSYSVILRWRLWSLHAFEQQRQNDQKKLLISAFKHSLYWLSSTIFPCCRLFVLPQCMQSFWTEMFKRDATQ